MVIQLTMIQTLALAVVVLYVGRFMLRHVAFLRRFCIPEPVVGGLLFSFVTLYAHMTGAFDLSMDMTLKDLFMTCFFTAAGFGASLKPLKEGGKALIVFLLLIVVLVFLQNFVAVVLAPAVGVSPLLALCTGSIPMLGGHGSAGAFAPLLEEAGVSAAPSLTMAAATFGLIAGSMLGGPLGKHLIDKYNLARGLESRITDMDRGIIEETRAIPHGLLARSVYQVAIAMGIGTLVTYLLSFTGMSFPSYIGAMIVGAVIRNYGDLTGRIRVYDYEISEIGNVSLSLFLAMALMSLQLWQLASLAVPMFVLLFAQVLLMFLFVRFVVFRALGRDYDAAVMSAGTCGFGMGATPNAMANMQALTQQFVPSPKAFLIIPVVGSLFVDFINSFGVSLFINFFGK